MIELRKNSEKNYFDLIIDGKSYDRVYANGSEFLDYHSENKEASQKLANYKLIDFSPFEFIWLEGIFSWLDFEHLVFINQNFDVVEEGFDPVPTENIEISFTFEPRLLHWNKKFSFNEYAERFGNIWKKKGQFGKYHFYTDDGADQFSITIETSKFDSTIAEFISTYESGLKAVHDEVFQKLFLLNEKESLTTLFAFPEIVKTSCEQYLLYFAQFLRDLGINATSNLKEEAGKVLFSVTPTDDVEALDKIREALAIYLSLSSNPISHSTGDRTVDMILSGARANALHLESQLELTIAKLQFKEATLELKDATIEQNQLALRQRDDTIKDLKEMLARGNIFEESLEKVVINGEVVEETSLYRFSREDAIEVEATPVLDESNEETRIGLVKFHEVTKLKDYGVSLDLPKAIRDLMDYFKRDKNK